MNNYIIFCADFNNKESCTLIYSSLHELFTKFLYKNLCSFFDKLEHTVEEMSDEYKALYDTYSKIKNKSTSYDIFCQIESDIGKEQLFKDIIKMNKKVYTRYTSPIQSIVHSNTLYEELGAINF